jgi:hypothetical protein
MFESGLIDRLKEDEKRPRSLRSVATSVDVLHLGPRIAPV